MNYPLIKGKIMVYKKFLNSKRFWSQQVWYSESANFESHLTSTIVTVPALVTINNKRK